MPGRSIAGRPYPDDDGSADPRVVTALSAYAAGRCSEHAALTALATSRLLIPIVALPGDTEAPEAGLRREKTSEMALPSLIGHDGRLALIAFTCLDAVRRWQPGARPVPVPAGTVWKAAAADASAVVIDIAGPVAVAVEGARLAALAKGEPVPPPHADPDVIALARGLVAREHTLAGFTLLPGQAGTDVTLQVRLAPGHAAADADSQAAVGRVAQGVMAGAGTPVRRGLAVVASESQADPAAGGR